MIDFLGLSELNLPESCVVCFQGISGSGKSHSIDFLLREKFQGRKVARLRGAPLDWGLLTKGLQADVLVIDELTKYRELFKLRGTLDSFPVLLIASHIECWPFRLLSRERAFFHFRTDAPSRKLGSFLNVRGFRYKEESLERFRLLYGESFTDLEIVLESSEGSDFDEQLGRFELERKISIERSPHFEASLETFAPRY